MPLPIMSFKPVLSVLVVKQSVKVNDPVIAVEWKNEEGLGRVAQISTRPDPGLPGSVFLLYHYCAVYNFASFC